MEITLNHPTRFGVPYLGTRVIGLGVNTKKSTIATGSIVKDSQNTSQTVGKFNFT